jgi:hypothetical protein
VVRCIGVSAETRRISLPHAVPYRNVCSRDCGDCSTQDRLRFRAPSNGSIGFLSTQPRRTLSHAQEKQRWRSETGKSLFKQSGKRRKKSARNGKVKRTTARHGLLEKILIWKGCSGGRNPPCISLDTCAGRLHGPRRSVLRQDGQNGRRQARPAAAESQAGETPLSASESEPSPPHPQAPTDRLRQPACALDRRD